MIKFTSATVDNNLEIIFVGTNEGKIHVFDLNRKKEIEVLGPLSHVKSEKISITSLTLTDQSEDKMHPNNGTAKQVNIEERNVYLTAGNSSGDAAIFDITSLYVKKRKRTIEHDDDVGIEMEKFSIPNPMSQEKEKNKTTGLLEIRLSMNISVMRLKPRSSSPYWSNQICCL